MCYKYAEKYNYEIIRFNTYKGNNIVNFKDNFIKKVIYQPELSTHIFNENDKFKIIDFWVSNKFIKKKIYIRALNSFNNNNYLNLYIKHGEDLMMNFILHRIAKSLFKINIVGYYHIKNSISLSNTLFSISKLKIKFALILLKVIFDYSKNTKKEKDMSHNFEDVIKFLNIPNSIFIIKNDFIFYKNFIDTFIKCKFISMENKRILESFKNLIEFSISRKLTNFIINKKIIKFKKKS